MGCGPSFHFFLPFVCIWWLITAPFVCRQGAIEDIRYRPNAEAQDQPDSPRGGAFRGASAPVHSDDRKSSLAGLCKALRSKADVLLPRSAVLQSTLLSAQPWIKGLRTDGIDPDPNKSQIHPKHQRSPRDPHDLQRFQYQACYVEIFGLEARTNDREGAFGLEFLIIVR